MVVPVLQADYVYIDWFKKKNVPIRGKIVVWLSESSFAQLD